MYLPTAGSEHRIESESISDRGRYQVDLMYRGTYNPVVLAPFPPSGKITLTQIRESFLCKTFSCDNDHAHTI